MRKKLLILTALILFSLLGKNYLNSVVSTNETKTGQQNTNELTSYSTPSPTPYVKKVPVRLVIPDISVDTNIESLGMAENGRMDVPKIDTDVGWWQPGVSPGERGNAVIDGHYDRHDGGPSVFYDLKKLKKGNIIKVYFADGSQKEFEVYKSEIFKDATFPINEVFGPASEANLNLITCGGVFDRSQRNYSDREVVFSKLIR